MAENTDGITNEEEIVTPKAEDSTPKKEPVINIEDLMAKARSEEKNKLYPEIEKLRKEVEQKTEKINAYLISVAEKDEVIKDLQEQVKTAKEDGAKEMGTTNEATKKELEIQLAELQTKLEAKDAEFTAYKTEQELATYKAEKLKEVDESVADMVTGNSKEAIDASVEKAKAVYDKVASKFGDVKKEDEVKDVKKDKAPLPKPKLDSLSEIFNNVTEEQLSTMSPKEYAEFRKSIGIK